MGRSNGMLQQKDCHRRMLGCEPLHSASSPAAHIMMRQECRVHGFGQAGPGPGPELDFKFCSNFKFWFWSRTEQCRVLSWAEKLDCRPAAVGPPQRPGPAACGCQWVTRLFQEVGGWGERGRMTCCSRRIATDGCPAGLRTIAFGIQSCRTHARAWARFEF